MRKLLLTIVLASSLAGCSMMGVMKDFLLPSASNGVSVEAELTVGDKEETIATDVAGEKTVNTAETITYNVHEENKGPSVWWAAFAFLGWVLPSPRQLWLTITNYMKGRKT